MQYRYVGDGAGIIGLPHEISDEEAEQLDVVELLKAAIENGSYAAIETPSSPLTPLPKGEGKKSKKE